MKPHHIEGLKLLFLLGICGAVLLSHQNDTHAFETGVASIENAPYSVIFTNENWLTLPHPAVDTFIVSADGSISGTTITGIPFVQYEIYNESGIRIHRFEIQEHYHYIIDGTVVYTEADLSVALVHAQKETRNV